MQFRAFLTLTAAVCLAAVPSFSQTLPPGVQKVTSVEGITEYAFPNGLHVLSFPDPSKPKVTVNVTYLVGSRQEGYGETGMAHLLEHLMFKETGARKNIKQELTDHGAQMNGTTSWDRTNYFETVNATDENLRWALEMEADRMVNARIEKPILDSEMTVVRNEFEMGENNPVNIMFQRALETAYLWHSYGHLPIGSRSDIENVSIVHLGAFYKKYYQPDNAVLTIAGKYDEAKTLAWVADTLGRIPKPQRTLEPTYTVEPAQDGERSVTLRRVGDTQAVAAMYHIPAAAHADTPALEVLAGVLGDTPSGRLYKGLVDNKKAVQAAMETLNLHDPGVIVCFALLRQEQSLDDAKQALLKITEDFVKEPPSKEEVERVKTKLLKEIDLAMTNSQQIALALSEVISDGDWRLLFYDRDEIKKVTPEDVARVAKLYLQPSNRTLGEFIPTKEPQRAEISAAPDLSKVLKDYHGSENISQGEVFDPTPQNIEARVQRSKLPDGMKLALLPKKNRGGTVVVTVGLRFGDEKSVEGKGTAAQLAGAALMRGTKNKSRQQIHDEMDKLKAEINVTGGATGATATIQTVEANLPGALRLAAEILKEPAFPANEFEQVRQQRLAGLEQAKSEPQALGPIELQRHLRNYPKGDPRHVSTIDEQLEEVKGVTLDDARNFYNQFYGASNGELVVVGQFDPAEIQKLAGELFGNWKSPAHYERVQLPYQKADVLEKKIETPDKQNALLMMGLTTRLTMDDPDYAATMLANRMFGQTFASRLLKRVRDKEGLSYGVGSNLGVNAKDDGSTFIIQAICAPQNLPKAEAAVRDELAKAVKDGFTADEIAAERKAFLQEVNVGRSQDGSLANTLLNRDYFDRTMKFDEAIEGKIAALSVDEVNAAFRKHIDPAGISVVRSGDFKKAGVLQ